MTVSAEDAKHSEKPSVADDAPGRGGASRKEIAEVTAGAGAGTEHIAPNAKEEPIAEGGDADGDAIPLLDEMESDDSESMGESSEDVQNTAFLSIAEIEYHEHERNEESRKTAGNLFSGVGAEGQDPRAMDPIVEGLLNEFSLSSDIMKNWIISLLEIVKPKRGAWSETILQFVRKLVRGKLEDPTAKWDQQALPKTPYDLVPMARKYSGKDTTKETRRRPVGWSAKMNNKELPSVLNEMPNFFVLSKPPNWTCPGRDSGIKELRGLYEKTSLRYEWFEDKIPSTTELQTSGNPESLILWAMNELRYPALYDLGVTQFGLCHRLDCQTSGPIIVAKTKDAWRKIVRQFCCVSQFQERKLAKMYLVLVHGKMEDKQGMINKPIKVKKEKNTHISIISPDGQPSFTLYWVLAELTQKETGEVFSLCLVRILTGRSHQIRVHMQSIEHSVVCDPKYGTTSRFCPRLFLHSYYLAFQDPDTDKQQQVYCPLHSDLREALRTLSDHSITASLLETGLITDEAMAAAKALIKPHLPRRVHQTISSILHDNAQESPLPLTKLRKLYEKLTDCQIDTELYGSKDLAALLKHHFPKDRLTLSGQPSEQGDAKKKETEESCDIPVEEKTWLFGKHKDHLEDENVLVSYKSEEKAKEPLRLLNERREQLATAIVAHEVKEYLAENDELGKGVTGRILVAHLRKKSDELVSLMSEWPSGGGLLNYVRKIDGVEEVDAERHTPAPDSLFRLGASTITSEQSRILDNLKEDLRRAYSYTSPSDWHKIIVPRPFPPIHGKHGGSLETVVSSSLGDTPPDTIADLKDRIRTASNSFELLFANLKKRLPPVARSVTPESPKRAKTDLVRRPDFRTKGSSRVARRSPEREREVPRISARNHGTEVPTLVPRRDVSRAVKSKRVESRGVRLSSARERPHFSAPRQSTSGDIARPRMRQNRQTFRSNVTSRKSTRVVKPRDKAR